MLNILLNQIGGMIRLIGNIRIDADEWTRNIQNEMDARYVEHSSLTNLFTENKFWDLGWTSFNLLSDYRIFYLQFQEWEQEDHEQK